MSEYNDIRNEAKNQSAAIVDKAAHAGYDIGYHDGYEKGLNDAWECAKKVTLNPDKGGISCLVLDKIFGYRFISDVIENYSASEAVTKLKEYEEKQKADEEIKVGDEVVNVVGFTAVVTRVCGEKYIAVMYPDGSCKNDMPKERVEKTGRHFDIQSLLNQMNEG